MKKGTSIKLEISYQEDREKMVSALASSGYKVRVEEEKEYGWEDTKYFVVFEIK